MHIHTVQQGEHLSGLAERYGFQSYKPVWEAPANADLRKLRTNPNVLLPGDKVTIPDLEQKAVTVGAGAMHKFVLRRSRLVLRLELLNHSGRPRAAEPCAIAVEGESRDLVTDGAGKVECSLAPSIRRALVTFADVEIPVDVGHLDPIDAPSGWQARLVNLGYFDGLTTNEADAEVRSAVEEFQCDNNLPVSGQCDAATQQKILEVHGI